MSAAASITTSEREAAVTQSGWGHTVRFFQPHNPAFYLYWLLVLKGAYLYAVMVTANAIYPTALMIAVTSQALYCLPWIWFLVRKDRYEREPAKLALLAFLWGGLVATWVLSAVGNSANLSLMVKLISLDFHNSWGPAFTAPIVEESSKYLGIVMLVLLARNHVRNAYDGFLLGAFVGLGFQVFENVLYIVTAASANFGSQEVTDALHLVAARTSVGLWSHTLFSAIAGTGLGYFLGATDRSFGHRLTVAILLFLVACVAHGCWDAALGFFGFLLIGVVIGTVAIVLAWRFSEGRQRQFIKIILADDVAKGTLSAAEMAAISGKPKDRRAYLKQIKSASGAAEAKRTGYVLDAAIDLAAIISSTDDPHGPEAEAARAEVKRVRTISVK